MYTNNSKLKIQGKRHLQQTQKDKRPTNKYDLDKENGFINIYIQKTLKCYSETKKANKWKACFVL